MTEPPRPTRRALILSPFATAPLDAGHRRRVFQMTDLLRRRGYRITFLLFAFEAAWRWGFEDDLYRDMVGQWDEIIVFHADSKVGYPPENGLLHRLDEWWSPELGTMLSNIMGHRFFDVFVVHNVWLSKAFDFAPPQTVKVLETHDLFWPRLEIYNRLNITSDFFLPSRDDEIFGINRADIAVMIQEAEARILIDLCKPLVVSVPFIDAAIDRAHAFRQRTDYLSPHMVTFGFLGTDHVFNVRGMQSVLHALERQVGRTFAPVDIVVGGSVQDRLWTNLPLRRLGRVPTEASLYNLCDFAIAPNFDGTGFKVKVADCLALGVPTIAATHAAIGTAINPRFLAETPEEMAHLMVDISLNRPPLVAANAAVTEARLDLRERTVLGSTNLISTLKTLRTQVVIDLRAFTLADSILPLIAYLSLLRHIGGGLPVIAILHETIAPLIEKILPRGVRAMPAAAAPPRALAEFRKKILDPSATGPARLAVRPRDLYLSDPRWHHPHHPTPADLPLLHPDIVWEPAVAELCKRWRRLAPRPPWLDKPCGAIVFVDHVPPATPSRLFRLTHTILMLNIHRAADRDAAVLHLLAAPPESVSVIWGCAHHGPVHRLVLEICALRRLRFHGSAPGGAVITGIPSPRRHAPPPVAKALDAAFATVQPAAA